MVAAGVIAAAALVAYANALPNPFLIDDRFIILGDPRVHDFDAAAILTREYRPDAEGRAGNRLWRPLTTLSFAANWAVSERPWAFRFVNLLLHAAVGCTVYAIGRKVLGSYAVALAAGLIFVVHPIHTTPLNQIVDRADVLAALFTLGALVVYLRDGAAGAGNAFSRPVTEAVLFAAGLLSKENAVALAGMIAVADLARARLHGAHNVSSLSPVSRHWLRRRFVRCYAPIVVVFLAYVFARMQVLGSVGGAPASISPLDNTVAQPEYGLNAGESPTLARWGTRVAIAGMAARRLVWPHPLSWDYSYAAIEPVRSWADGRLRLGAAVLIAAVAAMVASYRRRGIALVCLGMTLAGYAVVSNVFVLIGSAFAERYLYVPSAGFCLLAAGLLFSPPACGPVPARAPVQTVLTGIAVLALTSYTIVRNRDFRSSKALNSAGVRAQPRSARLRAAVAADHYNAGRLAEAEEHARHAISIFPHDPMSWRIVGLAQDRRQRPGEALAALERSFALGGESNESAVIAAADILQSTGRAAEAIDLLGRFVKRGPRSAAAHNNLGWYLLTARPASLRDPERALSHARRALEMEPAAADFVDTCVEALLTLGRPDDARRTIQRAIAEMPASDPARVGLLRRLEGIK